MSNFDHEFVYDDAVHGEVEVCIEYNVLEADVGYREEVEVTDVIVHTPGIGWGRTTPEMEDKIKSFVYEDYDKQSQLLEEARYD